MFWSLKHALGCTASGVFFYSSLSCLVLLTHVFEIHFSSLSPPLFIRLALSCQPRLIPFHSHFPFLAIFENKDVLYISSHDPCSSPSVASEENCDVIYESTQVPDNSRVELLPESTWSFDAQRALSPIKVFVRLRWVAADAVRAPVPTRVHTDRELLTVDSVKLAAVGLEYADVCFYCQDLRNSIAATKWMNK